VTVDTRQRIIEVTAELLQRSPAEPVSTRAICEAAGVSAPTLYHHFGDKDGLYDAVVTYGFESYLAAKHALAPTGDPVVDLCHAWDAHVDFGVTHPALYALTLLTGLLARVAQAGQLRIDLEAATAAIEAACVGATLQAIRGGQGADASTLLRDTVFASVVTGRPQATHLTQSTHPLQTNTLTGTAHRLAALLGEQPPGQGPLTPEEQSLLTQWLRRLS